MLGMFIMGTTSLRLLYGERESDNRIQHQKCLSLSPSCHVGHLRREPTAANFGESVDSLISLTDALSLVCLYIIHRSTAFVKRCFCFV